jgi:hypothetical protein
VVSAIQKLTNSVWNKEELPDQWKESYHYTNSQNSAIKLAAIMIMRYHCYQLDTKFYRISYSQG